MQTKLQKKRSEMFIMMSLMKMWRNEQNLINPLQRLEFSKLNFHEIQIGDQNKLELGWGQP